MREPWFLALERAADRGAVMRVRGHENCRCKSCAFEFRPIFCQPADYRAARLCRHEESLYGRCVACGRTWEEQARDREAARLIGGAR